MVPGGSLRVDIARRRAFAFDREIPLTKTAFDILALLLSRRGAVVTIEELVSEVWGYEAVGRPGFARTAVYRLRQELRRGGIDNPIEAIRGVGFRIADDAVEDVPAMPFDPAAAAAAATTAICVVSPQRRVIWANLALQQLTGYTLEELKALDSAAQLSARSDPAPHEQERAEVLSGHTIRGAWSTRRKDGSVFESPVSWKPMFDSRGELQYTIVELWPDAADVAAEGATEVSPDSGAEVSLAS